MRTSRKARHRRGKGPVRVLAALGGVLVLAGAGWFALDSDGDATGPTGGAHAAAAANTSSAVERPLGVREQRAAATRKVGRALPHAGRPQRLTIPALDVSAPVTGVDLHGTALVPPSDPQLLGWWRTGAVPGAARGTAVIAGHTVHTGGGAFDHLGELRAGDPVRLSTESGVITYVVRSVTVYPKATLATHAARVFSQSVPGRLALVTCDDWNGREYLSNSVVLATPITPRVGAVGTAGTEGD